MSLESRFRHIVAAFGEQVPTTVKGAIFRSPAPIDLPASLGCTAARRLIAERNELLFEFGVGTVPEGGTASLSMLRIGGTGGLVCAVMPRRAPVALAALRPVEEPALISEFLLRFMARNGATFGIDFLPGLPAWIRNRRPDLLDRRAMKRALWAWIAGAERTGVASWQAVRAQVADRWGRGDWPETLSHAERRSLLGMYLVTSYVELPHVGRHAIDAESE